MIYLRKGNSQRKLINFGERIVGFGISISFCFLACNQCAFTQKRNLFGIISKLESEWFKTRRSFLEKFLNDEFVLRLKLVLCLKNDLDIVAKFVIV